jgi:hypothetical protein
MIKFSHTALLLAALVPLLSGCAAKAPLSHTVVSTRLEADKDKTTDFLKVFKLDSDLRGNGWVMRKGASMSFGIDGSAEFEGTIYALQGLWMPNAVQLESVQYGPDGNMLFALPGNGVGQSLHMRQDRTDYPVVARFGFKPAHFQRISSVKFAARLLREASTGVVEPYSGK